MNDNLILKVDSYKASHFLQYPEGTTQLYSYVESRGGLYTATKFVGLQYALNQLAKGVTQEDVDYAHQLFKLHGLPFPIEGWQRIVTVHEGKIPLLIRSVREGLVIPTGNALITVTNTDPELPWLVSWFETMLLRSVWYATTVATTSAVIRDLILEYLELTSDDPLSEIDFKLHDFGARGVSSGESSAIGGFAHLTNFKGTDNVEALVFAREYYNSEMAGFSIPAAEHSTITSWGKEGELDAYRNFLNKFAKEGAVAACVSDSYDLYRAIEHLWGTELREDVIRSGATIVIRPDSGEPSEVVLKTVQLLDSRFGSTINSKGFKVLNHVRVIQGDGINYDSIANILSTLTANGYSASTVSFGMGGALLQLVNRDTQRFAYKCSAALVNNEWRDVYKDPITDPGKTSKKGRIELCLAADEYKTLRMDDDQQEHPLSVMHTVFKDGVITKQWTLDEIRELNV